MGHSKIGGSKTQMEPYQLEYYMLGSGSPTASGAANISGRNWGSNLQGGVPPDFDGNQMVPLMHQKHRGALDPDIPLIEQEIGPM